MSIMEKVIQVSKFEIWYDEKYENHVKQLRTNEQQLDPRKES